MRKFLFNFILSTLIVTSISVPAAFAQDDPAVDDVLFDAAERLKETETMEFVMELEGTTFVDDAETIQLLGAEGVMQRPDRVDVTFTAMILGRQQISIRMINVGDDSWITDIVTGKWVPSPPEFGYNPSILYDDQHGLGPVMERMNDPKIVGSEEIDGKDTWHITATADGDIIKMMTSDTLRGSEHALDIWVDKETNDILQISIVEPTDEDLEDPATLTLKLSEHDKDVTIEPPTDD